MIALVKLFKWLIITALALAVLAVAGYFSYSLYSDAQANKALTLRTGESGWMWQKSKGLGNRRFSDVQWRITEDGRYIMRRVYEGHDVNAWLVKNEDGEVSLNALASWPSECEENTKIKTSVTDRDGKHLDLNCESEEWGSHLETSILSWKIRSLNSLPLWSRNIDGFEVYEDFGGNHWDFQPAMRHLTLQSAKPREQAKE